MKRLKYDKEQLKFVEERLSIRGFIRRVLWFSISILGVALLYYVIFALFFNTEKEKEILRESKAIESEYEIMAEKAEQLDKVIANLQARDNEVYRDIFNAEAPNFYSNVGNDSSYSFKVDTTFGNAIVKYTIEGIKRLEERVSENKNIISSIEKEIATRGEEIMAIPSIFPIKGFSIVQTGATVGRKVHPFYKTVAMHTGLDLIASIGTDVLATASGTVSQTEKSAKGKGNRVTVDHGNGYVTTYSYLGDILIRKGQVVKQGMVIARVGSSGISFAPHLHYEVVYKGEFQDPVNYFFAELNPTKYKEMMMIALNTGQSLD